MPISDEIIELAPVKKTKSKLIIMFVIMGVLLALAATFLVLYLLKPSVEQSTSRVVGVETEQSELFQVRTDNNAEEPISYASVGNEYTVYATVSAEGDASTGVNWSVEPYGAVTEVAKGLLEGTENKYYFTFRPSASHDANTPVVITARSLSDNDQRAQIKFYIVKQGTESIKFNDYWVTSSNTRTAISGDKLELPFYTTSANNKSYYISFEQYGKYDQTSDRYAPITVVETDGVQSNKIEVRSSDESVLKIGSVNENSTPARFDFRMLKTGTVTLTITANKYNDFADEYSKEITVEVKSNEDLGYIDSIFISDQPVSEEFFEEYWDKQNLISRELTGTQLTLPYGMTYENIMSHVVIVPLSIQYDKESGKIKDGWDSTLSVTTSNTNALAIGRTAGKTTVSARAPVAPNDCSLIVKDSSTAGIGAEAEIKVNVVLQNNTGEISVKSGDKTYSNNEIIIEKKEVPTSPGVTSTLTVTYIFSNPPSSLTETDISDLANKKYIDTAFRVRIDNPEYFTVTIGATTIDPAKTYNFSESLKFSKVNNRITGTATFSVTVKSGVDIPNDVYNVEFIKVGTSINGASDDFNKTNRSWTLPVSFAVTSLAKSARFVDNDTALKLITEDGINAGKFVAGDVTESNGIYKGTASVYVQNRSKGAFPFDPVNLVIPSDGVTKTASCSTWGSAFTNRLYPLEFSGSNNVNSSDVQATITVKVTNTEGTEIANLTIKVYVIDSITSLTCESNTDVIHIYTKDDLSSFTTDAVLETRQYVGSAVRADYGYDDINLYYVVNGTDYLFAGEWNEQHTSKVFRFQKNDTVFDDVLFTYNSGNLSLNRDLFEYCYNTDGVDVTLGKIKVEYLVKDSDWYVGKKPSCSRIHIFQRKADGVVIYADSDYNEELSYNNEGREFAYQVDQLDTGNLYASAVISIDGDDVIVKKATKGALVEDVYIDFGNARDLISTVTTSDKCGAGDYTYYGITFRAPSIGEAIVQTYNATVHGASGYSLVITVANYSRQIESISVYADEQKSKLAQSLIFGEYNNALNNADNTAYIKQLFVEVTYQAAGEGDTRFEAVEIVLPTYLLYSIDGIAFSSQSILRIAPPSNDVKQADYVYQFSIYVKLDAQSYNVSSGGRLDFEEAQATGEAVSQKIDVTVGTGIKNIGYSYGGVDYTTDDNAIVNVTLALDDNNDTAVGVSVDLEYNTLVYESNDETRVYSNISYNVDNLTVSVPTVSGLSIDPGNGKKTLNISVDPNALKALSNQLVTITFTDGANYATGGKTFTIKFNITVTMDIFTLSQPSEGYAITTTGAADGVGTATNTNSDIIKVTYNNGANDLQPTADVQAKVNYRIVEMTGENTFVPYAANKIVITDSNGNKRITVANDILTGVIDGAQKYYVEISYTENGKNIVHRAPIVITTASVGVRLVQDGNIPVNNGIANIEVSGATDSFKLVAELYNRGSLATVSGSPVYELYSDPARTTLIPSSVAVVNNGVLQIVGASDPIGIIYYRASYTDTASGNTFCVDVNVRYMLTLAGVGLVDLDGNTFDGNVITLYFADSNNYTYLDLTGHIKASMAFGSQLPASGITLSVESGDTDFVAVDGYILRPRKTTNDQVMLTVKATYNGKPVSYECYVVVKNIEDIVLSSDATVDIIANETATVELSSGILTDAALTHSFTLSNADTNKFTVSDGASDRKTVSLKRDGFTTSSDYKAYTFTASIRYSLVNGSSAKVQGTLVKTEVYTITVTGVYIPEFVVKKDNSEIAKGGSYTIDGSSYTVEVVNVLSGAAYSANADNDIVTIGAFTVSAQSKAIVFNENKSGTVTLTVSATVYGKTYKSAEQEYTFTYGDKHISVSLSDANGDSVNDNSSVAIDHVSGGVAFTYVIDATEVGTPVSVGDVQILCGGDGVTVGSVTEISTGIFNAVVTVTKPTALTVRGVVKVNGTTYYTDVYSLTLTATVPTFTVGATDEEVLPLGTSVFSVTQSDGDFKGTFDVTGYEIVSGSSWASINASTGELTANNNIYTDKSVTVRATVTVKSGAYAGRVYTVDKTVVIIGVDLPALTVNASNVTATSSTVDLESLFALGTVDHSGDGSPYSYDGKVTFRYTVDGTLTTLASGDYSIVGNTLTINDNANTKAGGSITFTVAAVINSGINNGNTVYSQSITVTVLPKAYAVSGIEIVGKAGSYDVGSAVALYSKNANGFVTSADVSSAIVNYSIKNNVSNVPMTVNGDTVTLSDKFTDTAQVELTANILITTGDYAGVTVTCDTVITVNGYALGSKTVSWVDDDKNYETVRVAEWISGIGSALKTATVTAVTNAGFMSVEYNGTAAPEIRIDKDANIVGQGNAPSITVGIIAELNNGKTFYCEGSVAVAAITPELQAESTLSAANNTYEVTAGSSFIITISEKHGLDIAYVSCNSHDEDKQDYVSCVHNGSNIVITASADVTSQTTVNGLTAKYSVADSVECEYTFNLVISPVSTAAFNVSGTQATLIRRSGTATVESTWSASGGNNNVYGYSLAYTGNTALYSVTFIGYNAQSAEIIRKSSVCNYTARTYTITLYTGSTYNYSMVAIDSFELIFELNANAAAGSYDIPVVYKSGSASNSRTFTSTAQTYDIEIAGSVSVRFIGNGGTFPDNGNSSDYDMAVLSYGTINMPNVVRSGYELDGWYTDIGLNSRFDFETNVDRSTVLYAKWSAKRYTIDLKLDEYTTYATVNATYGSTYSELVGKNPTKTGYTFGGWYTAVNGGGDHITGGTLVGANAPETLFAYFIADKYNVTFDANGGTLNDVSVKTVTYGSVYGILPTPTKLGYTFVGWFTVAAASGGTQVTSGTTVSESANDQTLYARYAVDSYTVTLDANGGTLDTAAVSADYGTLLKNALIGKTPTLSGYDFDGWYVGGVKVTDTDDRIVTDNVTAVAHWAAKEPTFTVTFDANGGSFAGDSVINATEVKTGDMLGDVMSECNIQEPDRDGYKFVGWYINGTLVDVDNYSVSGNTVVYARWDVETVYYTVTLNYNNESDGDVTVVTLNVKSGDTLDVLTAIVPNRDGYVFTGWNDDSNGAGTEYSASSVVGQDVTLYAQWQTV